MPRKQFTKKWCRYTFSKKELQSLAMHLAQKTQEKELTEEEKKSVMTTYKERIDALGLEIKKTSSAYKDGYEMRDIECEVVFDRIAGQVIYRRTDTGEEAERRDMTGEEKQMTVREAEENAIIALQERAEALS